VWIDDLQWGDVDSALLLRELLLPPEPPKVLLLVSYRTEDHDHTTMLPVLSALASEGDGLPTCDIELGPMEAQDAWRLAEHLRGGTPDAEADLRTIVAQSGGSPFFIAEMSRCASRGAGAVPPDLSEVMRQRLQRLPAEAREIAEIAGRFALVSQVDRACWKSTAGHPLRWSAGRTPRRPRRRRRLAARGDPTRTRRPTMGAVYDTSVSYQRAMVPPISWGESSWRKWLPFTVTSVWFGQLRQSWRCAPTRMTPGSALTKSFGTGATASQSA
jgi:hypothetical protein